MDFIQVKRDKIDLRTKECIFKMDGYACRYCGTPNPPFHLDHVYPVSKGGETSVANLVTACRKCNSSKHSSIIFPKPIGYFQIRTPKDISFVNVLICALGILAVMNGTWNAHEHILYGTLSLLFGAFTLGTLLLRLSTGRS